MRTLRLAARLLALSLLVCAGVARAQVLSLLQTYSWSGASNSNVVLLSPDERFLFVSNQGGVPSPGATVSVLAVGADGTVSLAGIYPTGRVPCGMAHNGSGDRLYLATGDGIFVHAVAPTDGALSALQVLPPIVLGRYGLWTGIQYASTAAGDFVFQNENLQPANLVTAYRVEADGTLTLAGSYATGDTGSISGLYAPPRLLAVHGGRLFAANAATVSVFDILPDGTLSLAPGSPWPSPVPAVPLVAPPAAAVATDPSGGWLYATYDGVNVVRSTVLPDGSLAYDALFTSNATYPITGLAMHPSGRWFVSAAGPSGTRLYDTLAPGAPIQQAVAGAGVLWNAAGDRLYMGTGSLVDARVRVQRFGPDVVASCVGAPSARVVLPAPADACGVAVDASNGLAGSCADQGGGLASCTFDGQPSLFLGLGPSDVIVTATSSAGATSRCTSFVQVVDVTAPAIAVTASPVVLWPPDHRLVPIALAVHASDVCDPAPAISCAASSNEPDDGLGDGDTTGDVQWAGSGLSLRAERSALGQGRVYTLACTARDASGNAASAEAQVTVPHDWAP